MAAIVVASGRRRAIRHNGTESGRQSKPTGTTGQWRPRVLPAIPDSVSVVIPTLNAGPGFQRVLAGIGQQAGLGAIEVVVVDSGSTDRTREEAADAGAMVLDVAPEDFGHGRTRNFAAEATRGDVLVMLVQDALLLGPDAVLQLALELRERESVAAVSARQVPRSDADIYAAYTVFAQDSFVRRTVESCDKTRFESMTPAQRRAAAGVDHVCAALKRAAWNELRFSDDARFGEDVDFGVRAVRRGWTVRHSRRAAVAHSHTRDAGYHFRRAVADRLFVASVVGEGVASRAANSGPAAVAGAGALLASEVQGACEALAKEAPLSHHFAASRSALRVGSQRLPPQGELTLLTNWLGDGSNYDRRTLALLRRDLVAALGSPLLHEFGRGRALVRGSEAAAFLAKLTASVVGRALGDSLRLHDEPRYRDRLLEEV
jgi:GT2 family glycosyltransferase